MEKAQELFTQADKEPRGVLLVHGSDPPGDAEWQEYVEALRDLERRKGVGVVVLERLSDALRSGRRVLAVVRGSAVSEMPATAVGRRAVHSSTPKAVKASAPSQYCRGGFSKYLRPLRRGVSQSPVTAISRAISA